MITCPQYERLAPLFYDGELDGPLRREVRSHVVSCTACTRSLASIERTQELLLQELDSQVEDTNFANFWEQVEEKLHTPTLPWFLRLQLWREKWWPRWSLGIPAGAAAAVLLLILLFLPQTRSLLELIFVPRKPAHFSLAANNQAHIESLSAAGTVALWNEPASNATVIWIGDDREGAVP